MSVGVAFIEREGSWLILKMVGPWDAIEEAKDALKAEIPAYARSWNKPTRTWRVLSEHLDDLRELLEDNGFEVEGPGPAANEGRRQSSSSRPPPPPSPAPPPSPPAQAATIGLSALFGHVIEDQGLADKAFRALAMVLHPDKGGEVAAMRVLNAAWQEHKKG
ncbi:MAG: J domain-containing protein [Dehalococcoidia bacterium]|nr:J domain-containing protein [Dehalococcoidia bacterium]